LFLLVIKRIPYRSGFPRTRHVLLSVESLSLRLGIVFSGAIVEEAIVLRGRIARNIKKKAAKLGVSVDEYIVELLTQTLDPKTKAIEYIEAAKELLQESLRELEKGNMRQASEKLWSAGALAIKAYAYWKDERRLSSHGELWEYKRGLEEEFGEWISDAWAQASTMHICFYEGWCARKDVENAYKRIEKLVKEIASKIKEENQP